MDPNTARVFVRDIALARRFGAEALGLKPHAQDLARGWCVFNAGNCELVLRRCRGRLRRAAGAGRARHRLVFLVPNLHVAHQDLKSRGVEFTAAPERQFWGGSVAGFRDPDGNRFQLVERDRA